MLIQYFQHLMLICGAGNGQNTMHKIIFIFLAVILLAEGASAQQRQVANSQATVNVPGYFSASRHIQFGDSLVTVITNTDTVPVSFFPKYNQHGLEYLAYNVDSAVAPLRRAHTSVDNDTAMMQILVKLAEILKSNLKVNAMVIGAATDQKADSSIRSIAGGINSIYNQQCNNFAMQAYNLLHATDSVLFNSTNMRITVWPVHAVLEVKYKARWAMFDYDVGMPAFTVANPASPNGLASVAQIVQDTSLITPDCLYFFQGYTLGGDHSVTGYRETFANANFSYSAPDFKQLDISGLQTLCAGCSMVFPAKVSSIAIDTSTPQGNQMFHQGYAFMIQAYATQDPIYWDSLAMLTARLYNLTSAQGHELFSNPTFPKMMMVSQGEQWWQSPSSLIWNGIVPTFELHMPQHATDIVIGQHVSLPFFVTGIQSSVPITVGDTTTSSCTNVLWSTQGAQLQLPASQVNYFVTGNIPAHGDSITVSLAYNPEIVNVFHGFDIEQYNGKPLHVSQQFIPVMATGIATVLPENNGLKVFPNLLKPGEIANVNYDELANELSLYSIDGKLIFTMHLTSQRANFSAPASPGLYLVKVGTSVAKLVVQQ